MAQVQITLPTGVSKEDYEKSYATWLKQREQTGIRDKANRQAAKALQDKYPDEFKALQAKFMPKG